MIIPLLKDNYPQITFVTHEEVVEKKLQDSFYATYSMGLFFDDKENVWQPTDFRMVACTAPPPTSWGWTRARRRPGSRSQRPTV